MIWVRTPAELCTDPSLDAVSDAAQALHHRALAFANLHELDCWLPRTSLHKIRGKERTARELVSVGWWLDAETGWRLVKWADLQPTKSALEQRRANDRDRQHRHRHGTTGPPSHAVTPPVTNTVSHASPDRSGPIRTGSDQTGSVVPGSPRTRASGERPAPRREILTQKLSVRAYEPLTEHRAYAAELGLDAAGFDAALAAAREKLGDKPRDVTWLDVQLCAFIETQAKGAKAPGLVEHEQRKREAEMPWIPPPNGGRVDDDEQPRAAPPVALVVHALQPVPARRVRRQATAEERAEQARKLREMAEADPALAKASGVTP